MGLVELPCKLMHQNNTRFTDNYMVPTLRTVQKYTDKRELTVISGGDEGSVLGG